jgi:murein DD-endopeptidase MepM/ murein hydrolase activator NlpD
MNKHRRSFSILVVAVFLAWSAAVPAHETDQFSNRADPIADSTDLLNEKVNAAIARVAEKQRKDDDQMVIVDALFGKLGSRFLVDRLEGWAIKSPEVEKLQTGRFDSIYSGHPIWATRVTTFFGVGDTIRINDQLVGTDKIGHFMSQGRKIYRRYLKYDSEERAVVQAAHAEFMVFGQLSNGNFSNADLVANYEGHRFFRSLFEDDIVSGKPAILRWENDGWVMQRDFDWSDHVNEYWDEALNVNHFDVLLYPYMVKQFVSMCPQYWENPTLYTIADEQPLKERYAHLGMKDNSDLRLDSLCAVRNPEKPDTLAALTY